MTPFLAIVTIENGQVGFDFTWVQNHLAAVTVATMAALAGVMIIVIGANYLLHMINDLLHFREYRDQMDLQVAEYQTANYQAFEHPDIVEYAEEVGDIEDYLPDDDDGYRRADAPVF